MAELLNNINEARAALTEKPLYAADAERILIAHSLMGKNSDEPQPVRFARAMSAILDRVSVPLEEYDVIAGRVVHKELTDEEEILFAELLRDPRSPYKGTIFSSGHCSYDWEMIAENGLVGLIEKAKSSLAQMHDEGRRVFLSSLIEVYEAIARYILRYAAAAEEKGMDELALTLRCAATEKPSDMRTLLQLFWIITLIDCSYVSPNPTLTVGRLDRILYPFYKADIESGRLTRESAAELITDYYCKHNLNMGRGEHQVGDATNSTTFERIFNFDAPQYLMLGGSDVDGNYTVNELTALFAECIQPEFKNPVIVFYYVPGMEKAYPELWRTLMQKALQSSSLMIYNDANIKSTYRKLGLLDDEFENYHHFGCNWPSPGSHSFWINGKPNSQQYSAFESKEEEDMHLHSFTRIPAKGWQDIFIKILRSISADTNATIDLVYEKYFALMDEFVSNKTERGVREIRIRRRKPYAVCSFTDCFTARPIERGECFTACAEYIFAILNFQMFGTVADCFIVTDALVFRDKRLTLSELIDAIDANFEGYARTLALCRRVPKYGSDDAFANAHVRRLAEGMVSISRMYAEKYLRSDGFLLVPCLQSDTWHLKYGKVYGATPDGRLAGSPFSQNSRPANGSCTGGLTAMFNSMLNIPADGFVSGALNLDVDRKQFEGDVGEMVFGSLLATYFERGGLHAQVTSVRPEDLRDAQINPHLHKDLRVRITGYSGVFVDISRPLQDDIIERMK